MRALVVTEPLCQGNSRYLTLGGEIFFDGFVEDDPNTGGTALLDHVIRALLLVGVQIEYVEYPKPRFVEIKHTPKYQMCRLRERMEAYRELDRAHMSALLSTSALFELIGRGKSGKEKT